MKRSRGCYRGYGVRGERGGVGRREGGGVWGGVWGYWAAPYSKRVGRRGP